MIPAVRAHTIRCPVCGTGIERAAWKCERCESPHHQDCAEYFGGCAIFGCRDGHRPDRMEMQTWPAAVATIQSLALWRARQEKSLVVTLVSILAASIGGAIWGQTPVTRGGVAAAALLLLGGLIGTCIGFAAYCAIDAIWAAYYEIQLREQLGATRAGALEANPARLRQGLPRPGEGERLFRTMRQAGYIVAAAGVVLALVGGPACMLVAFAGAMLIVGADQLHEHRQQASQMAHRLEATFAPALPAKPSPPRKP